MTNKIKNIPESVKRRLKNLADQRNEEPNSIFQYYVMERFLFRLSKSPHAELFVLKGALMLHVFGVELARATRDIDFLVRVPSDPEHVLKIVKECLRAEVEGDGVRFDENSIETKMIQLDTRDRGVRVQLWAYIGSARFRIQVDIASGGEVIPEPSWIEYPGLLEGESSRLLGYPKESIVADKFEAMVSRDTTNSRLKDFYDIWILSETSKFEGATLQKALKATFDFYQTPIPTEKPICFTEQFIEAPGQTQRWKGFLKNALIKSEPDFVMVMHRVETFLMPICAAIHAGREYAYTWEPASKTWVGDDEFLSTAKKGLR